MDEISKIHKNKAYYDMSNREENYKKLSAYKPAD